MLEDERTDWPPGLVTTYQEQYVGLVRLAFVLLGSQALAEEVVQDAVLAVRNRWDGLESPGGYLRTTVVNGARMLQRRGRVEDKHRPVATDPDTSAVELIELRDALDALPFRQRAAVALRYLDDLDFDEIATALDCRPGTARSLVSRGLAALRVEVDR